MLVNEQKALPTGSGANTPLASVPSPEAATTTISRKERVRQCNPASVFKTSVAPAPAPPQIIDDSLEEDDVKLSIQVSVIGRSKKVAEFTMEKTLYGATQSPSLFKDLDLLIEEIYEATAIKTNRKLHPTPEEIAASVPRQKTTDDDTLLKQPLPLLPQGEELEKFFASMPPNYGLGPR